MPNTRTNGWALAGKVATLSKSIIYLSSLDFEIVKYLQIMVRQVHDGLGPWVFCRFDEPSLVIRTRRTQLLQARRLMLKSLCGTLLIQVQLEGLMTQVT